MHLFARKRIRLVELHLRPECLQEQLTYCLVDDDVGRVSDGGVELLPELSILSRIETGHNWERWFHYYSAGLAQGFAGFVVRLVETQTYAPDIKGPDSRVDAVHS